MDDEFFFKDDVSGSCKIDDMGYDSLPSTFIVETHYLTSLVRRPSLLLLRKWVPVILIRRFNNATLPCQRVHRVCIGLCKGITSVVRIALHRNILPCFLPLG